VASPRGAAPPATAPGSGKRILGLPRTTVIAGGIALTGALAYFLYTRKKSSTAGADAASSAAGSACTDANGNPGTLDAMGNCNASGTDDSADLSALQTELQDLQGEVAGGTGSTGTTTPPAGGTTTPPAGGTTTPPAGGAKARPHVPGGESAGGITATSATVRWTSVAAATSYRVRAWTASKKAEVIHDHTDATTAQTISGLKAKTKYGWHVAAVNSAGESTFSPDQHFTTR
jgi:Fibronectin type III domain